ncbi:MAG TPA: N-acetylmuramoyl-L-alanine amidase [Frankiaceae bacterium]|nr:N-acetylmuramoyl-L-alanine amidase [Frankiaceae bacterium]
MSRTTALAGAFVALAACTSPGPGARPTPSPAPTTTAAPATAAPTTVPPTRTPSPLPTAFGGADVVWPRTSEQAAPPPALGAVVTRRVARHSGGGTLAAGLTLPRVGGTPLAPRVLTPCGRSVVLAAADVRAIPPSNGGALPKKPRDVVVVVDPGHGGPQRGAIAPDGDEEKVRNLQVSLLVRDALRGRAGRVVLTRERDFEATLEFRAALVDALRADAAVSVHLNSSPDGPRKTPGTETFGSTADGAGRRFSGIVYEHLRRYVQTLPGPWVGDRDAGAKYRVGANGRDYYGLLRRTHRPFVISEAMYISSRHEAALVAKPEVRRGLAGALADALVAFTQTRAPGSGWVTPYRRPADPAPPDDGAPVCVDPAR